MRMVALKGLGLGVRSFTEHLAGPFAVRQHRNIATVPSSQMEAPCPPLEAQVGNTCLPPRLSLCSPLSRLLSCTSDPPTACRREHNCSNPPAGTASTSPPRGTTHPSPLAALRLQTLMLPAKGPPIEEGNLPWLWKQLQNAKINESNPSCGPAG